MHTTLCILIEILTYQRNKYGKKKVRAIIRRTATKDESYFSSKVEFVRPFFGGNVDLKKSFRICLTFSNKTF